MFFATLLIVSSFTADMCQTSFEDLLAVFPEYQLPLDIQSLTVPMPENQLSPDVFKTFFTSFANYDLIWEKTGDTTKIYPIGRVRLHPNYYSLIFAMANRQLILTYLYNFDINGIQYGGYAISERESHVTTLRRLHTYYFIQADSTIYRRDGAEDFVARDFSVVTPEGGFQQVSYERDNTFYDDPNWMNAKIAEQDSLAIIGTPILTGN
ncbi:MAG: hypothetical protein OEW75_17025 [Cyclobacteriaceae bacterium]|nr:hypothetical protein [Cyclobacteriaceae bacterium]